MIVTTKKAICGIISASICATGSAIAASIENNPVENVPSTGQRIINGTAAGANEFPYAVYIDLGDNGSCTGSLIAPQVVLTAAHCLVQSDGVTPLKAADVAISVGSVQNFSNNPYKYNVIEVYIHPEYDNLRLFNDIGLVVLEESVPNTIATPVQIYLDDIPDGMNLVTAGWGTTDVMDNGSASSVLLKVDLIASSSETCSIVNADWTSNQNEEVCVIVENHQGTCFGDSGGPLSYVNDGKHALVGITSYDEAPGNTSPETYCGYNGAAEFFTHAGYYLLWITSTTGLDEHDIVYSPINSTEIENSKLSANLTSDLAQTSSSASDPSSTPTPSPTSITTSLGVPVFFGHSTLPAFLAPGFPAKAPRLSRTSVLSTPVAIGVPVVFGHPTLPAPFAPALPSKLYHRSSISSPTPSGAPASSTGMSCQTCTSSILNQSTATLTPSGTTSNATLDAMLSSTTSQSALPLSKTTASSSLETTKSSAASLISSFGRITGVLTIALFAQLWFTCLF